MFSVTIYVQRCVFLCKGVYTQTFYSPNSKMYDAFDGSQRSVAKYQIPLQLPVERRSGAASFVVLFSVSSLREAPFCTTKAAERRRCSGRSKHSVTSRFWGSHLPPPTKNKKSPSPLSQQWRPTIRSQANHASSHHQTVLSSGQLGRLMPPSLPAYVKGCKTILSRPLHHPLKSPQSGHPSIKYEICSCGTGRHGRFYPRAFRGSVAQDVWAGEREQRVRRRNILTDQGRG